MTITPTRPAAGTRPSATDVYDILSDLDHPLYVVAGEGISIQTERPGDDAAVLAAVGPMTPQRLGSSAFREAYGVEVAYMAGAMAGGIASEDLVIALAREGYLASFGAAGLLPERIEQALQRFAAEIPGRAYAVNLIHSPSEDALERGAVDLFLKYGVRTVEASAFMDLTPNIVRYRLAGLSRTADGGIDAAHSVIAKVSRPEVAEKFMRPASEAILTKLLDRGQITAEQAELGRLVPVADDITVEADSGGHTDRRPLPALFPVIVALRERIRRDFAPAGAIRIGAAGGIGTPRAAASALALGADYVVTGSVNQSCLESGTSDTTRRLLATAGVADVDMAPAADMFEMGVELQVLRKGTMFPMRASKLYELYRTVDGLDDIPAAERAKLEKTVFKRPIAEVWDDVQEYFSRRDPEQLRRAADDPKRRMALVFRWYLGMASRWAVTGEEGRAADYQIWCGPAMGAFNDWVTGTWLAAPENRRVADVARELMRGAAFTARVHQLALAGVRLPTAVTEYRPEPGGRAA